MQHTIEYNLQPEKLKFYCVLGKTINKNRMLFITWYVVDLEKIACCHGELWKRVIVP